MQTVLYIAILAVLYTALEMLLNGVLSPAVALLRNFSVFTPHHHDNTLYFNQLSVFSKIFTVKNFAAAECNCNAITMRVNFCFHTLDIASTGL
jgi:hypothetical protein